MKKLVLLYGKSASGKSAIKKAIMKLRPEYNEVITSCTRYMREGEKDGVDYFFYTEKQMADKICKGEMAECVVFNDWIYGTEYEKIIDDKINVGAWNPEGVETLNDDSNFECLNIFIDAPGKTRLIRSLNREENPDVNEIIRRYQADEKDFRYIEIENYVTINNNGSKSIQEMAEEVINYIDRYLGRIV